MALSESEAAAALADIAQTETRARLLARYKAASPFLLLWGSIWVIGFGVEDARFDVAGRLWTLLDILGAIATIALMWRLRRRATMASRNANWVWQGSALVVLGYVFILGTFYLLHPRAAGAGIAYSGLLTGSIYAGIGVFLGLRWLVTGVSLIALTFAGYFFLPAHFSLWMAVAGGGALILAGLWLRRV